jgi:hypothetical protein
LEAELNMSKDIPEWLTNLALDIYKFIQAHNVMPHFQKMVDKWAEQQKEESDRIKQWKDKRRRYFEEIVVSDDRLRNKSAGPPEENWQWESYIIHKYEKTESGLRHITQDVSAWVSMELSIAAEPEVRHILPLSNKYELSLAEKYAILAAIYERGRRGTEKIPLWDWPGPNHWSAPNALLNAKKCIFFEILSQSVLDISKDKEVWLRTFIDDIKKDISTRIEPAKSVEEVNHTTNEKKTFPVFVCNALPLRLFISYSHQDRKWLTDVIDGLAPLKRKGQIEIWADENIPSGAKWKEEIDKALQNAHATLLLVSRHYLASDFISKNELPYLLNAAKEKKMKLLWVLIGQCMWETELNDIQAVIDPKYPLNSMCEAEADQAIKEVCKTVLNVLPAELKQTNG